MKIGPLAGVATCAGGVVDVRAIMLSAARWYWIKKVMSGPMNESAPERVTAVVRVVSKKIAVLFKGKADDWASEGVMMPASNRG